MARLEVHRLGRSEDRLARRRKETKGRKTAAAVDLSARIGTKRLTALVRTVIDELRENLIKNKNGNFSREDLLEIGSKKLVEAVEMFESQKYRRPRHTTSRAWIRSTCAPRRWRRGCGVQLNRQFLYPLFCDPGENYAATPHVSAASGTNNVCGEYQDRVADHPP